MGKIEDMRRLREQQFAESEVAVAKHAKAAPASSAVEVAAPKAVAAEPVKVADSDVAEGKCPECGKTKPVQNGVMASHQKGFGKNCAGSRKPPA